MPTRTGRRTVERWDAYLAGLGSRLEDKGQRAWFAMYALGLLSDRERKNVEPIAVRACGSPGRMRAVHQCLDRCLAGAPWHDAAVRAYAAHYAARALAARGPIRSWVVDDVTSESRAGVGLLLAADHAHVASDFRLYLPEDWAADRKRCRRAQVPECVGYAPRWCLALDMIDAARAAELPGGVVVAGSDYGSKAPFRDALSARNLRYALEIKGTTKLRCVHPDGARGLRIAAGELACMLESRLRRISWREHEAHALASRFARVRVVVEREDGTEREPEWLLIEWPEAAAGPTRFALSTLEENSSARDLVRTLKSRWRFARAHQDLQRELSFDRYDGRSFVGWHHHVSVVLACSAFLAAQRARAPQPETGASPQRHLHRAA